ncbi:MAG: type II secretion system inner membrane protein GspF [Planctomycetota bacterium]|nr:type II secretion system inner membrane protein GspF [Planctomycetota bacterium]
MPIYSYQAVDSRGRNKKGTIDADTARDGRDKLRHQKLRVTKMQRIDAIARGGGTAGRFQLQRKANIRDLAILTRQFSTLLASGVHLSEALTVLVEQIEDRRMEVIFRDIREKITSGTGLADAFSLHPAYFSDLYINMVRAGEASGNLDEVLLSLANYLQKQASIRGKISAALTYPAIMVMVGIMVVSFLMTFVVPKITEMLLKKGNVLPRPTEILIFISDMFKAYWLPGMIFALIAMVFFRALIATEKGRLMYDTFLLKIPVIGSLLQRSAISRFTVTLSILLKSGLPALDALNIVGKVVNNALMAKTLAQVADRIVEGADISTPLKKSKMFPPMVGYMIAVGEQSGELESVLDRISEAYEEEIDLSIQRLTAMVEPVIIVLLAVAVGFIVMAVLLPLLQFNNL